MSTYRRGLASLGSDCYAWMQPDGGWGLSNAGLVVGSGTSLLVDTLFDLHLAREMLGDVARVIDRSPIETVVNTHSDGDHVFGNELLAARGAEIIASAAAAERMTQEAVDSVVAILRSPGREGDFVRHIFGRFRLDEVTVTPPHRTFEGGLTLDVGGREVRLIEVGPAHTQGDALVHVPDARTLYTGDILFSGGTPVVWAGPVERWISALDLVLDMDVDIIVPGHGPLAGKDAVRASRDYLVHVEAEARKRFEDGLGVDEAIASIDLGHWADLPENGRLAQNVINVYRHLDPAIPPFDRLAVLNRMGRFEGFGLADRAV
ncbi:beta-lactamase (plasmid) [Pseudonocardia sp. EC080610-09]|uniref:MBL fold metallo-hydrolase n=1 Tax=unclassified Pseudonocardia TaxID=2619320 RepID=UPI00070674A7|nr:MULTISPECIES: MBL fold metallo-hydrolase [unclassified Pseudonocardia]ALL79530.1 beta-lactamase [Pseudonocardia sp. EC080610-09]ALL85518.1 beta-lactamase [Pseudonocardia sp. EC080619-01]